MPPRPEENLRDLDDLGNTTAFILSAHTAHPNDVNRIRVASQMYLAHKTKEAGERLTAAVATLADAFERASQSSERHARGLTRATWALVGVTVVLAIATAAQAIAVLLYHP